MESRAIGLYLFSVLAAILPGGPGLTGTGSLHSGFYCS